MKFACIGASGYGNVGDDGYRLVFAQQLPGHELLFDCPYPDPRVVDWCDALIIGGGGLIYHNETAHFEYMSMYLDRAMQRGKPVAFISCGIQIKPQYVSGDLVQAALPHITPWRKFLEYASLVTVRSPTCLKIVQTVAPEQANAHFVPDACYVMPRSPYALVPPDSLVIIPTARGLDVPVFQDQWKAIDTHDRVFIAAFARDDISIVDQLCKELGAPHNLIDRKNLSAIDAMGVVQNARTVVTARYHGAVFARAAGLPESAIISADDRYKGKVEVPPANPSEAWRQFDLLREAMKQW